MSMSDVRQLLDKIAEQAKRIDAMSDFIAEQWARIEKLEAAAKPADDKKGRAA